MVEQLFLKPISSSFIKTASSLSVGMSGTIGNKVQHPFKQLLILPIDTLDEFSIQAGHLKEDIVIDTPFDIHALSSGTIVQIGSAQLRLTFHCEPCSKIKHLTNIKKIVHQRGYHSQVLRAGHIKLGDKVQVLLERREAIPYTFADRIKWYLDKYPTPILASDLINAIGLSSSYCRAVPAVIRHRADIDKKLILYKKNLL
jgi:MOSC domain-containing protein YiiM